MNPENSEIDRYTLDRETMVAEQLEARGIREARVLAAMGAVPRHLFVPPEHRHLAYVDGPLPIGEGQTISQPYIVALMSQLLGLQGEERVLEIGTGTGYQAAVLAHLAKTVHSVERYPALAQQARVILAALELDHVAVHVGDGSKGLARYAPYDAVIVTAAAPRVPAPLLGQLKDGGRLVLPVGGPDGQMLQRWVRLGAEYDYDAIAPVAFVPMRGVFGWEETEWNPGQAGA